MKKAKFTRARRYPPRTPYKSCNVDCTDKYITVVSEENWGGKYFSRHGLVVHSLRNVTPKWLGENVRKALESSEYYAPPAGIPIDQQQRIAMEEKSTERRLTFWDEIARIYGYKSRELAWKKKDHVFISWFYKSEPDIEILSSKSSVTGNHSAWPLDINEDRVFLIPFTASDEEIGEMVLKALAKCEGPGKSTEPLFP
ncbi:contact-dependent growth inhibition system immunity protein [Acetobacter sp. P1H12_c]|uniref:contact-dependent growth inhibition system immunity protein n=1 Tax=Acetobacter sp. P1H12_c TaxID=2762621 RepID=UPI001C05407F|nr:contact-dependent growth inhibition system immunity protein [Acetobacter sp. P1H12_c]